MCVGLPGNSLPRSLYLIEQIKEALTKKSSKMESWHIHSSQVSRIRR